MIRALSCIISEIRIKWFFFNTYLHKKLYIYDQMISGREMFMKNDVNLYFTDKAEIFRMLQKRNLVQKSVNFVLFWKGLKKRPQAGS